ncbi:MAG: PP0621 family protein [Pseudomonadota bacterium]
MKFLLLIGILALIIWFWSGRRRNQRGESDHQSSSSATEAIVVCAHCRLHVPESESILADGHHYCCDEHRKLGAS